MFIWRRQQNHVLVCARFPQQLWGFAPAGSPLDRDLLELFNFGKFFLDREQDVRVAVQVGKGEGTLKENQVEIIELLAGEWVLP